MAPGDGTQLRDGRAVDNLNSDLATRIRVAAGEAGILPGDALAPVLEALAEIPAEVRQSITPLIQQIEAAQRPTDNGVIRQAVAQGIRDHAADLARTIKIRTWFLGAGLLLVVLLMVAGAGYWYGQAAGYLKGTETGLSANAVIAQMAPADGLTWEQLIRDNPGSISISLTECAKTATRQNGRLMCLLPVWLDEPNAPTKKQ